MTMTSGRQNPGLGMASHEVHVQNTLDEVGCRMETVNSNTTSAETFKNHTGGKLTLDGADVV
jgi:hypothetical protein